MESAVNCSGGCSSVLRYNILLMLVFFLKYSCALIKTCEYMIKVTSFKKYCVSCKCGLINNIEEARIDGRQSGM